MTKEHCEEDIYNKEVVYKEELELLRKSGITNDFYIPSKTEEE